MWAVGPAGQPIVDYSLGWIDDHPDEPLNVFFLPPLVNVYFEGLVNYDPAFGGVWVTGTWYDGFDAEASLAAVDVPTACQATLGPQRMPTLRGQLRAAGRGPEEDP